MADERVEDQRIKYLHHQQDLLFNRFNYFLIGTAFLIAAFASMVSSSSYCPSSNHHSYLTILSFAVVFFGFFLAVFFSGINYFNSASLKAGLESYADPNNQHLDLYAWAKTTFESKIFRACFRSPFKEFFYGMSPHTYFVPLLLACFWFIAGATIINHCVGFIVLIVSAGLILLISIIVLIIWRVRLSKMGKKEDEIRIIAYKIWEETGCVDGHDYEHWLQAEVLWEELQKKDKSTSTDIDTKSKQTTKPSIENERAHKKH
jgi:hypothetical protein